MANASAAKWTNTRDGQLPSKTNPEHSVSRKPTSAPINPARTMRPNDLRASRKASFMTLSSIGSILPFHRPPASPQYRLSPAEADQADRRRPAHYQYNLRLQ